jgi:hypothetical protein
VAAGGDGRADVGVRELRGFRGRGAEKLFDEIVAAAQAEFFGEDAQRIFRDDEVDAGDAVVGFEGAEYLLRKNCARGAGDGEG